MTAWVRIPTLDYNDDVPFYIHYGVALGKASTAAGVWEDEPYQAVNHLSSAVDTDDSTREMEGSASTTSQDNYNTENMTIGSHQVVGKIGKALDFDGNDDRICLDHVSTDGVFDCSSGESSDIFDDADSQTTISLWYWADDFSNDTVQMLFEEGGGTNGINMYIYNSKIHAGAWASGNPENWDGNWLITDTTEHTWHNAVFVLNDAINTLTLYHDGVKIGDFTSTKVEENTGNDESALGANDGSIDMTVSGGTPCQTSDSVFASTHASSYTSTFTRGYWFQAQSSFTVSDLQSATDGNPAAATATEQSVAIVDYGLNYPVVPFALPSSLAHGNSFAACLLYTSPSPRDRG